MVSTGCRGGPTCRAGGKAMGGLLGTIIGWTGWLGSSWSMGASSGRRCSNSRGWPPKPKASGVSGIQLVLLRSGCSVFGELEGKAPGFSETSEASLRGVGLSKSQAVGVGSWHHLKWGSFMTNDRCRAPTIVTAPKITKKKEQRAHCDG